MITRVSDVIRPKGSDLIFDHPYQFEISDMAAIEFAPALYGALAAGRAVDAAVAEARKAIYAVDSLEWATPVLHLRADNAYLFDITRPPPH